MGDEHPQAHDNLKPWAPGQSGNPAGRPKTRRLTDLLEAELAKPAARSGQSREQRLVERLVTIALGGKRSESLRAMQLILAYTDGLPVQTVELDLRRAAAEIAARTGADADWLIRRAQAIAAEARHGTE